ncbi:hypothetical protein [Nitrosopumilus sp.]|uniref:hypothetical protein n=1 Tax=Nitrosopumilus sp. TaxID=2024843 RepID=UPI00260A3998|nr:hypothetical protein [Nitrosopumilus sp.]
MNLDKKHSKAFKEECHVLSSTIVNNLQNLAKTPSDERLISKMIQSADTIMGSSQFLKNRDLEQMSRLTMTAFKNLKNNEEAIDNIDLFSKVYFEIMQSFKKCPYGYNLENDSCTSNRN